MYFSQEYTECNKQTRYNALAFSSPGFSVVILICAGHMRKTQHSAEKFLPFPFFDTCNHIFRWKQNEMVGFRDYIWPCHVHFIFNMSTK